MKTLFTLFALLPTAVFAHTGDHSHTSFFANLRHLATEPDHLVMLIAAIAVAIVIYLRKGRSQ
ncbi:HupE/UreJ family protein [Pseudorhodobacter sp. W20_MBD10_FR17]|uniref:HupE/UreJ family protein n=1 Tax=Pseudorhodobacter sp. W20_MBD10_FR17 TaxID=3240266 RepID=UPI003F9CAA6D